MIVLLYTLIALFGALAAGSALWVGARNLKRRRRMRKDKKLSEKYIKSLYDWAYRDHVDRESFSRLVNGGSRFMEVELIARMSQVSYGHINHRIEKLVRWRHLDRMLVRLAMGRSGYARAGYLRLLSQIPFSDSAERTMRMFERDRNRYVRLYALLARINHAPDMVLDILADYKRPLGSLELSQIALLLRRRFVPTSIYEELLSSYDRNQQMLGLYIVRLGRVELAAPMVARLIPTPDKVLRNRVLHTLVSIRGPLTQRRTISAVSMMGARGRKRFYRLVAGEGYSLQALHPYVNLERGNYLGHYLNYSVNGQKRKLHAMQSLN